MKKRYKNIIISVSFVGFLFLYIAAVFFLPLAESAYAQYGPEDGADPWAGSIYDASSPQTPNSAEGADASDLAGFLSWVVLALANALGKLLTLVMDLVNKVFAWQDFSNPNVDMAWQTVRDLCNMFFILILLLIAFSAILRYENYSLKRTLPKLVIMAVLINFSKTVCYLLIDFSQVVMLSFANTFAGSPGNFVDAMGLRDVFALSEEVDGVVWGFFYASVAALVVIVITTILMVMMLGILIMRVVMFWVLIVLSPLAFFSSILPGGGYFSKWWGEFSRYLIAGPILAFFIYLALSILSAGNIGDLIINCDDAGQCSYQEVNAIATQIGSWENISAFILAVGLLVGAMKMTQSIGAAGAGVGMALAHNLKNRGTNIARWGQRKAVGITAGGVKSVAKWGGRSGIGLAGGLMKKVSKEGGSLHTMGTAATAWRQDMIKSGREARNRRRLQLLEKMGMKEDTIKAVGDVAKTRLGRGIKHMAVGAGAAGVGMAAGPVGWAAGAGVVTARLIGGWLKRREEKRGKDRGDRKKIVEETKKSEIEKESREKDRAVKVLDLRRDKATIGERDKELKKERDLKIADADSRRDNALSDIAEKLKNGVIGKKEHDDQEIKIRNVHKSEADEAHDDYNDMQKRIIGSQISPDKHEQELKKVNDIYTRNIGGINIRHDKQSGDIDREKTWMDKQMSKYLPNRVMIGAAQLGAKDTETAEKRADALAGGSPIHSFGKASLYSDDGFTNVQKKLFDRLAAATDTSTNAVRNMILTLEKMAGNEGKYEEKQLNAVLGLKQGLAAFKKSGGDTRRLEGVIEVVNKINTGGEKGRKTVQDFESSVIGR